MLFRSTAWLAEDTLLVVLSMFVTLQDADGAYESTLGTMSEVLPRAMFDFLAPRGTSLDTPVVGAAFARPEIPGPGVYDLRTRRRGKPNPTLPGNTAQIPTRLSQVLGTGHDIDGWRVGPDTAIGSNNFAVAGALTANGGALVANDMHLGLGMPSIWYRAAFKFPGGSDAAGRQITGVTLPVDGGASVNTSG